MATPKSAREHIQVKEQNKGCECLTQITSGRLEILATDLRSSLSSSATEMKLKKYGWGPTTRTYCKNCRIEVPVKYSNKSTDGKGTGLSDVG